MSNPKKLLWFLFCSLLGCFAIGLFSCQTAISQDSEKEVSSSDSELKKQMEDYVKKLDSNKLNERDLAEARIIALGPKVTDMLPPVSDSDSEEIRMRIERIRVALDKENKALLITPSSVTLQGTMTGAEALRKISVSTGNKIPLEGVPNLDRMVTAEFEDTPFWEAFDEVLDQIGLSLVSGDGEDIQLIEQPPSAPMRIESAGYCGVFRIEPIYLSKNYNLQNPKQSSLNVQLQFSWEPRLSPSLIRFPVLGMELVCDNGEILTPTEDQEVEYSPVGGSQMLVNIDFTLPSKEAKRIKKWTGVVFATLPGKPAAIAFTDLIKSSNKTLTNGMLQVTLEQARKNRDIYEILVGVSLKASEEGKDSVQAWASLQEVFLFDKDLNRIENVGWSTTRMNDNDIGLSYLFEVEKGLEGCKFVFRAPGSLNEEEIEFELQDIYLP